MRKKLIKIVSFVFIMTLLVSCKKEEAKKETIVETKVETKKETKKETEAEKPKLERLKSAEGEKGRVFAIMIDNHPDARPQSGLNNADYIFEYWVEGGYTRYLSIFYSQKPERVGPIRSARPYFIQKMKEFDPVYVHVGGSSHANYILANGDFRDLDGMALSSSVMWRFNDTGKFAPHNMYTNWESLINYTNSIGYDRPSEFVSYNYGEESSTINGKNANKVTVEATPQLTNEFVYNKETKKINMYRDGELNKDENTDKAVEIENHIVQFVDYGTDSVNSNVRAVEHVGSGKGYLFNKGKYIEITWKRNSENENTKYYHNGEEIVLSKGLTWVSVIDNSSSVVFE